jgi:hypothetical protein
MPNIPSSTSSSGAMPAHGPSPDSGAGPAARQGPIGPPFGAHLRPKPHVPTTTAAARPLGDPLATSSALGGDLAGAGPAARAGQPGVEAADDQRRRFRFDEGAGSTTSDAIDPLDPMTRALFAPGLRSSAVTPAPPPAPPDDSVSRSSRVSLEHVLTRLVRRIAWSGDAHTGSARLELGAGALEGATLTIHSDQGKVSVSLEVPPGVDREQWKERIARRLGARGLQVAALEVE